MIALVETVSTSGRCFAKNHSIGSFVRAEDRQESFGKLQSEVYAVFAVKQRNAFNISSELIKVFPSRLICPTANSLGKFYSSPLSLSLSRPLAPSFTHSTLTFCISSSLSFLCQPCPCIPSHLLLRLIYTLWDELANSRSPLTKRKASPITKQLANE